MNEHMIEWGGSGPALHLAHANSFHPGTYKELIEDLKENYTVYSILMRPFHQNAQPEDLKNWDPLRDEMITLFDKMNLRNVIGVGHSLGSTVTMMAAIKRPDLFSKLVIIEPPCVDQIFFHILSITPYFIAKNIVPPSAIALKRRHKWPSRENAFELLRPKKIFGQWSDETLRAYLNYGLTEDENGEYRLTFSKYWESKIYCTIENPYRLFPQLKLPSLCIRAENSDVIEEKNWNKWQRKQDEATFISIAEAGHLVPMERPRKVGQLIKEFA